jgi:hypothetical protein
MTLLTFLLIACDFQGVAVGEWDVSFDSRDNTVSDVWLITPDGEIVLDDGETSVRIPVDLAGSRISWAIDAESENSVSFAGSVNGSRFAGTLYTQEGNRSVYGRRRRD